MTKVDKEAYKNSLDKLTEVLTGVARHADEQSTYRCPYKNRHDECTAKIGCRNQRKPKTEGGLLMCGGDDKLDYRTAWESDPDSHPMAREPGAGHVVHDGVSQEMAVGKTLFDYADDLAMQVPTSCGRTGHCHECVVEVKQGHEALGAKTEEESFLRGDYRLACQAVVENVDQDVEFAPLRRTPKILTATQEKTLELDPVYKRKGHAVFRGDEEVDRFRGHLYGLAIDLGTTTVVLELIDLETGDSVQMRSFENPQRFGGSDIMNRISYDGEFPGELRRAVVKALNHEINELCSELGFVRQEIYEVVVAGNSTMRDLIFKLDVQGIGQKPYKSVIENEFTDGLRTTTALVEKTRRLGLRANPKATIYSLPLIASHVGADVAADLIAVEMGKTQKTVMLVDVGTNTEVVVAHQGRLMAASCPAGPAFEGGEIQYGMPGHEGAIESIRLVNGSYDYSTIGHLPAEGICGSGLIDLLAELRRHDRMTPKGVFADRQYELSIVPERGITFSRQDASNLAQAKAANYCGQYIVLRAMGIGPADLDKLYLAGGFANYVDVENAVDIGFLAPANLDKIVKVGNASVQGAREALLSRRKRSEIESLVKDIQHVELETTTDFFDVFVEGCQFKPMPTDLSSQT